MITIRYTTVGTPHYRQCDYAITYDLPARKAVLSVDLTGMIENSLLDRSTGRDDGDMDLEDLEAAHIAAYNERLVNMHGVGPVPINSALVDALLVQLERADVTETPQRKAEYHRRISDICDGGRGNLRVEGWKHPVRLAINLASVEVWPDLEPIESRIHELIRSVLPDGELYRLYARLDEMVTAEAARRRKST